MTETADREVDLRAELKTLADGSKIVSLFRRTVRAVSNSRLASLGRWLTDATKHSFLYRWLTAEPEPEVIVIDLRETYTVGPVVAILDRLVASVAPPWRTSRLKRATDAFAVLLEAAAETKTGQTIAKLFEPPEPPDRGDEP